MKDNLLTDFNYISKNYPYLSIMIKNMINNNKSKNEKIKK